MIASAIWTSKVGTVLSPSNQDIYFMCCCDKGFHRSCTLDEVLKYKAHEREVMVKTLEEFSQKVCNDGGRGGGERWTVRYM